MNKRLIVNMKCICLLLSGFTIAFAIRVPSSWHEDRRNVPQNRYKDIQSLRMNKNMKLSQSSHPPVSFHRNPNILQKHEKSLWNHVPRSDESTKFSKPSTREINGQYSQPTLRYFSSKFEPVENSAQDKYFALNRNVPAIKNPPTFTTIISPIDSDQILIKSQSLKHASVPYLPTNSKFQDIVQPSVDASNQKSRIDTPRQNQLLDFLNSPIDFQGFISNSPTPTQKSKISVFTESPYQNSGSTPTMISSFPIGKSTEQNLKTITSSNIPPSLNFDQTFNIPFNHEFVSSNHKFEIHPKNHLHKNYRDDRTHEPLEFDPFIDDSVSPTIERNESEIAPISSHEHPADIPTKPIYPGQGLWAKRGLSHKPFIRKQKYGTLEKDTNIPDGYDTFTEGEKMFNQQQKKITEHLNILPKKYNLDSQTKSSVTLPAESKTFHDEKSINSTDSNEVIEDSNDSDFVPMKLYAQVRHSENVQHLPINEDENGRLREAIKESKIQTVYTEEGYEDDAYDHEGHEKNAESEEEFEELDRGQEKAEQKRAEHKKYNLHLIPKTESTRYSSGLKLPSDREIEEYKKEQLGIEEDSDIAESQFEEPSQIDDTGNEHNEKFESYNSPKMKNSNDFISTKEIKTMKTKENDEGDTETEISSQIKVVMQPNSTSKAKTFIKVNPKIYKNFKKITSIPNSLNDSRAEMQSISNEEKTNPNSQGIYIEEIITTSTQPLLTTSPTTQFSDFFSEEIPITTLPTTAIPSRMKINSDPHESLDNVIEISSKETRSRMRRFVNDFPNIQIDNGFISTIKHDFVKPQNDRTKAKYPYHEKFEQMNLNENSPLRYSEDLNRMPIKTKNKMAFYDQADSRIECSEIESTVEPIPERVINAGREEETDDEYDDASDGSEFEELKTEETQKNVALAEQPKVPRLNGLGDKIDCLKAKYFGENPLDSPFFDEDTVGPVKPIFKDFAVPESRKMKEKFDSDNVSAETQDPIIIHNDTDDGIDNEMRIEDQLSEKNVEPKAKIENEIDGNSSNQNSSATATVRKDKNEHPITPIEIDEENLNLNILNDISRNINPSNLQQSLKNYPTQIPSIIQAIPTISLLTTPEYTIDLEPEHIYDQIDLLNYLPSEQEIDKNESHTNMIGVTPSIQIRLIDDNGTVDNGNDMRQQKSYEADETDTLSYDSSSMNQQLPNAEALKKRRKFRIRRKRPGLKIFDINKFIPAPYTLKKDHLNPNNGLFNGFQVFDINKFLPSTQRSVSEDLLAASTVLPKYKILSEVFYKDDIKPNEQLNVFTDILNNIRNSSGELPAVSPPEVSHTRITSNSRKEIGQAIDIDDYNKDTYLNAYNEQEVDDGYKLSIVTEISTTEKPKIQRGNIRFTNDLYMNKQSQIKRPSQSDDEKLKLYLALSEAKMRQLNRLQNNSLDHVTTTPAQQDNYSEQFQITVEGMNPPSKYQHYKTIYHPKRDNAIRLSIPGYTSNSLMNKYIVMGMKPPPRQKVLVYSDYLTKKSRPRIGLFRRSKRSMNRSGYAEVPRNQDSTSRNGGDSTDDDEDEYIPHRPKNYYYDEKTGKIVYKNEKKTQDEDEEEFEYVEITEAPKMKTTSKPKQNPIFATATPPPDGQSYIDFVNKLRNSTDYKLIPDPTTTERNTIVSTEKITTPSPISTTPPEFLNILSKIRETSEYGIIKDPEDSELTTTEAPEEMIDEEYEEEIIPIISRNSPGGEPLSISNNFQVFDITDYIPKLKNYLPRTSIDYSKYKTIERHTSKGQYTSGEGSAKPQYPEKVSEKPENSIIHDARELNEEASAEDINPVTTTTTAPIMSHTNPSRRKRPTLPRNIRTTRSTSMKPPATLETAESKEIRNEKPRRNFRRRPIRMRSTTTERFLEDEIDDTTKIIKRRRIDGNKMMNEKVNRNLAEDIKNPSDIKSGNHVEVFQEYNQQEKHGGNYRREDDASPLDMQKQKLEEPVRGSTRESKYVEIVSDFDKTKPHGGNYKKEDGDHIELEEEVDVASPIRHAELEPSADGSPKSDERPTIIQMLPKQEDEETEGENFSEKGIQVDHSKTERNSKTNKNHESVERLTDVVPKPESFYSDLSLPRSVNLLMIAQPLLNEESGETMHLEDDLSKEDVAIGLAVTTKKPSFIKDPSERLYYYAPV